MVNLVEHCSGYDLEDNVRELDQIVVELYIIAARASTSGYLSDEERLEISQMHGQARRHAEKIGESFLQWRQAFGFDPTYVGLHRTVAYLHSLDSRVRGTIVTSDLIDEKRHRYYRRQAKKNLGGWHRRRWALPEPFNTSSSLMAILTELDDCARLPKKTRIIRKRAKRLNTSHRSY